MKIFRGFDEVRDIKNPVVTTGTFDGVHIGHKAILNRLQRLAREYDGESVLITFDPHPRKVLYPDTAGKHLMLISSIEEKLELLEEAGLDNVIIVRFTREFSKITSEEFVRDYLYGILRAKVVVVGFNHHFGNNKEGDYKQLWGWREKYGFEAEEIPEQEVQHETVSSTKIRKAITEGYIQRANAYLDHYYMVISTPEKYPTGWRDDLPSLLKSPLSEECKILPATGIYATSVKYSGVIRKAMAIITTLSEGGSLLLLHILENEEEFTDKRIRIFFHKLVHGNVNLYDKEAPRIIELAKARIADLIY